MKKIVLIVMVVFLACGKETVVNEKAAGSGGDVQDEQKDEEKAECNRDSDCKDNARCFNGVCKECESDFQCRVDGKDAGFVCKNGKCVKGPSDDDDDDDSVDDDDSSDDDDDVVTCVVDIDCADDLVCDDGKCVNQSTSDDDDSADDDDSSDDDDDAAPPPVCAKDTDCKGDRICDDGKCVNPPPSEDDDDDDDVAPTCVDSECGDICVANGHSGGKCASDLCVCDKDSTDDDDSSDDDDSADDDDSSDDDDDVVGCVSDAECKGGRVCQDGACVTPISDDDDDVACSKDTDCSGDLVCEDGECVAPGPVCSEDSRLGKKCVVMKFCSSEGVYFCPQYYGEPECDAEDLREPEICDNKDNDCDGEVDEGFDLDTDRNNCGECGNKCPSGQICSGGQCQEAPQACIQILDYPSFEGMEELFFKPAVGYWYLEDHDRDATFSIDLEDVRDGKQSIVIQNEVTGEDFTLQLMQLLHSDIRLNRHLDPEEKYECWCDMKRGENTPACSVTFKVMNHTTYQFGGMEKSFLLTTTWQKFSTGAFRPAEIAIVEDGYYPYFRASWMTGGCEEVHFDDCGCRQVTSCGD